MAGNQGNNRIVWTDEMLQFLKAHWQEMTAQQLADALGLQKTVVRMKMYSLGLKKTNMEYWTEDQVNCLRRNYTTLGDTELAEIFSRRWKKQKGWSKKHIEKKRRQLGLRRTKAQRAYVQKRNIEKGRFRNCPVKAWENRPVAKEGEIRVWTNSGGVPYKVVKVRGRWVHYAPWYYRQYIGHVPQHYVVRVKNGNPLNITKDNLELVHKTRHGSLNRTQSLEYKREQAKAVLIHKITQNEKQIIRLEQSSL